MSGEAGCSAGRCQECGGWALAAWVSCSNLQPFALGRAEPLVLASSGRDGGGEEGVPVCRCEDAFAGTAVKVHLTLMLNGRLNPLCL